MTTGFGPSEFFISQWPEVPEQLFRPPPRPDGLALPPRAIFASLSLKLAFVLAQARVIPRS